MTGEPLLPAHLDYLRLRNQRPRSIEERRMAVMRTNHTMGHPVADATKEDLRTWQQSISHLTPAGQSFYLAHTIGYIKWTVEAEHRIDDPTGAIVRMRNLPKGLPHPMSDSDVGRALLTAQQPERAWIALGAFCGLRCMEIGKLQRAEVRDDTSPPVLEIEGKGGKYRVVPLPERVLRELQDAGLPARGYLWARLDGKPGPPSAARVSRRINEHLHAQEIHGTAHALRHRFGTMLYRNTRDIALVAQIMGHSSVNTTRGYALVDPFAATDPVEAISRLVGEGV